jgi:NADH-quinone oxidoreductase subunit N
LADGAEGTFSLILALVLVVVGFGFKVAAVPFHFWTPDVYQGAPTPITAFISTASKAASFALLLRVFLAVFPPMEAQWTALVAAMAAATMTLGNVLALPQRNIKRLLAYSSIAQAGYVLVGVVAISDLGAAAVAFYLFMYVFTNIGAFTVVVLFSRATGSEDIADYAGLSRRAPNLALAMVVALLSLGGIPPLAGFFGKFYLFTAAVQADMVWLAVVGVLNAILALYYYLSLIKVMYVDRSEDQTQILVPRTHGVTLVVTSLAVIIMGTISTPFFQWAVTAADGLNLPGVMN